MYRADELFGGFPLDTGAENISFDLHLAFQGALPGARFGGAKDEFLPFGKDGDGLTFCGGGFHAGEITLKFAGVHFHVRQFV